MTRQYHGVLSLGLMLLAIGVGVFSVARSSVLWGLVYLGLSVMSLLVIIWSFCSKCPCREHSCGHVLLGKITRYLPWRAEGKYSAMDLAGVVIPVILILIFPQFWLKNNLPVFGMFWALLAAAGIEISAKVCRGCGNKYCPVNGKINRLGS